jgi:hypothetical protein
MSESFSGATVRMGKVGGSNQTAAAGVKGSAGLIGPQKRSGLQDLVGVFDDVHHESTLGLPDPFHAAQAIDEEMVVTLNAFGDDLAYKINISRDVVVLDHFYEVGDALDKGCDGFPMACR